jgi:hypothetical protein
MDDFQQKKELSNQIANELFDGPDDRDIGNIRNILDNWTINECPGIEIEVRLWKKPKFLSYNEFSRIKYMMKNITNIELISEDIKYTNSIYKDGERCNSIDNKCITKVKFQKEDKELGGQYHMRVSWANEVEILNPKTTTPTLKRNITRTSYETSGKEFQFDISEVETNKIKTYEFEIEFTGLNSDRPDIEQMKQIMIYFANFLINSMS